MKKLLAVILALAMVIASLSACGQAEEAGNNEPQKTQAEAGDEKEDSEDTEPGSDKLDFGGAKIVVGMYTGSNITQPGIERVFAKINEFYMSNYNIDVEILPIPMSEYKDTVNRMLSSGEQIDVFDPGMLNFTNTVSNEALYDMYENDLIQTYGQDILDLVLPEFLRGCVVNGALYGIPCMRDLAVGMWCIVFDKQYLDGINYDFSNLDLNACNPATVEEMDALFEELHAAYPDINVIYPWGYDLLNQKFVYDPIGGDNFGVLLDPANSLEVSDLFESDMFREYCELMYKWNQAGYISKDAATETQGGGAQIMAGTLMCDTTGGKPGIVLQKSTERGGLESVAFQLGPNFVRAEQASVAAWGISVNTENPEAAMVVLNDLYCNETITNLLLWGEKDVDYIITEDGHCDFPEGITKDNAEYYNLLPAWALPCEYSTIVRVGDDIDLWEQTIEFNNNSQKSKAIGFSFDASEVSAEYTALTNVWVEYANSLLYGQIDPAVGIPELRERLEAAGLQTYIEAKRAALNKWAEENGIN